MTKLHHAIKIAAPREKVFNALTNVSEFAKWHYEGVEGDIAVGAVLTMNAKAGMRFGWKTTELVDNARLVQECVEGPGETGKLLTFDLADADGGTLVKLTDGPWRDGDHSMAFCNTHWGNVLHRLKGYVESSSA